MDTVTVVVFVGLAATAAALASGVASMARDGEVGHYSSAQWMTWRVALQAGAVLIILIALLAGR